MSVHLFTLDSNGDVAELEVFPFVEDAMEAAEIAAGEKLEWGDTQLGYEAIPLAGQAALHERGEYPNRYWQILGIDENGEDRDIENEDHRE
jgi:hypothetical protein